MNNFIKKIANSDKDLFEHFRFTKIGETTNNIQFQRENCIISINYLDCRFNEWNITIKYKSHIDKTYHGFFFVNSIDPQSANDLKTIDTSTLNGCKEYLRAFLNFLDTNSELIFQNDLPEEYQEIYSHSLGIRSSQG